MTIPFLLSILGGLVYVLAVPRVYEAQTLLLLENQKEPEAFVRPTDFSDGEAQFRKIVRMVTSRDNLERILKTYPLYGAEEKGLSMDDSVRFFAKNIFIERVDAKGHVPAGTSTLRIRFRGEVPESVLEVTDALATNLILDYLGMQSSPNTGESAPLSAELESVKRRLNEKENALKTHEATYGGDLAERLKVDLSILEGLRVRLNQETQKLKRAKGRRLEIRRRLGRTDTDATGGPGGLGAARSEIEEELQALRDELASLEARYTPKHPDVVRLRSMIVALEKKARGGPPVGSPPDPPAMSDSALLLERQLGETELEIKFAEAGLGQLRAQVNEYQTRVAETRKREQERRTLGVEYEALKETYDALLKKKLEIEMGLGRAPQQADGRLRIVESAKRPELPVEPDLKQAILLTLLLGVGLGCISAFIRERVDSSYQIPEEVERELHLPVLISLPIRYTEMELKRFRRKKVIAFLGMATGFVLSIAAIVIAFEGFSETVDFVRTFLKTGWSERIFSIYGAFVKNVHGIL